MHLTINGSLGDVVALTAIPREYRRQFPDHIITAETNHPELFLHNPHIGVGSVDDQRPGGVPLAPDNTAGNLVHAYGKYLGIKVFDTIPEIYLVPEDFIGVALLGPGYDLSNKPRRIAIDTWAGWPSRRWSLERFVELAHVLQSVGWTVVEVGATTHDCYGNIRPRSSGWANISFLDACTIRQTAAVIKQCSLFIGNDSGLAHVAAAVGTKSVVIYSVPWYSRAYRSTFPVIDLFSTCIDCRNAVAHYGNCLAGITVDDVVRTCDIVLQS
jgi:ADP-heptose:LPS heptosyltransferase